MAARFVRLRISGFKSFADSVSLEIMPGLTGIVGPNGCGKSNVAEALRWAMGEANARSLRGEEMDDVIFAGAANRPSHSLAEVNLTIEDDGDGLPAPFASFRELQIARRLERGSGSVFRVNGRETRARDVHTLFADLASGTKSSAMVSQGRVGTLINARPEQRRAVLEEAAGTTGLHSRRSEAETRLRSAEGNLNLAEQRWMLLERQLDKARTQAKQADRYRAVVEAVLDAEAAVLGLQRARAAAAHEAAATWLASAAQTLEQDTINARRSSASAEMLQGALPMLRDAEATARTRLERIQISREALAAEVARTEAARAATMQRHLQIDRDLDHAKTALNGAEQADARIAKELERLSAEALEFPAAFEGAQIEAGLAAAALREADHAASAATATSAEATARFSAIQQSYQQAESRARRAQDAQARLDLELSDTVGRAVEVCRLHAVSAELAAAEARLVQSLAEQEQFETERSRASEVAAVAREKQAGLDAVRHRLTAEMSVLTDILGVKDCERWPPMVDSLTVPHGLEAALGAVLGEELAAAEDPDAARHWRSLPPLPASELPGRPLTESVKGPAMLARALAGIGLVKSEAEGDAGQGSLRPGQTLVTIQGAVWRWDGYTVRAGTQTAAALRLQQRNRLDALRAQLTQADLDFTTACADRHGADKRDGDARSAEQRARAVLRDSQSSVERARSAARSLRQQAEATAARLAAVEEQVAKLAPEREAAAASLEVALSERAALPDLIQLRADADHCRAAVTKARARDVAAIRSLDGLQRAQQAREGRFASFERERADRRARTSDLENQVTELLARAQESAEEKRRLAGDPARAAHEAEMARARLQEAEAAHAGAMNSRDEGERRAADASLEARTMEHAAFAAREALARAQEAEIAARQARLDAEIRAAEHAAVFPRSIECADLSAAAEDRARSKVQRLLRERDELGPVNLRAAIEAAAVEAEMQILARERDELGTAIAKLRGSIGHLNREGREKLTAIFQQVDRHFQSLFTRMFGGGRAHLALVGSEDPLEAGLEIYAQPPGKKLSMLSLLSGGEQALTALSIIFAVFRCNPAPLCVLDEVDAPLDDANVERLCALLSDMANEAGTRFLVVTHHQITMARMDRLYGVTMQELGVSRLLSVDLSHAYEMAKAIAAE